MNQSQTQVVIIGCGYAGRSLAKLLDDKFNVVVIDPREKLVHKIMIRSAVRPEWVDCMLVPNDHILSRGRIVKASVKSMDLSSKTVTLSNGEKVSFDYCVIASGAMSRAPVEPPAGLAPHEFFNGVAAKIADAHNIVLVGGGPVAIELAGEIKAKHPNTSVTVVSRESTLCHNMNFPADTSDKIVSTLASVGVATVFGMSIDFPKLSSESLMCHNPPKTYSDNLKDVDLVINCTGSHPSTSFVPREFLNEKHQVKVDQFLKVAPCVFAMGDCTDVKEAKNFVNVAGKDYMAGFPVGHSDVVAANIEAEFAGSELAAYTPNTWVAGIIPCGPKASVTLGFPDEYGAYKGASYFYEAQFQFAKADHVPKAPAM